MKKDESFIINRKKLYKKIKSQTLGLKNPTKMINDHSLIDEINNELDFDYYLKKYRRLIKKFRLKMIMQMKKDWLESETDDIVYIGKLYRILKYINFWWVQSSEITNCC